MTELKELSTNFRRVRLLLAREKGNPDGDRRLNANGQLNAADWKKRQAACRIRRFRDGEADRIGRLRRKPGGQWYIDYVEGERDDEIGFRFNEERFVPGEYVSIGHAGTTHTYQVARVEKP